MGNFKKTILFLCSVMSCYLVCASPVRQTVHSGWKFKQARLENWYPATVPGVVHTDLLANGIIEDPFLRLNERGLQWIDKEDWIYETTFDVSRDIFTKGNVRLFFEGLDTYADVFLNGEKILEADNMFREWRIDVKKWLKEGKNTLRVYFHSPIKVDMPKWEAQAFHYIASNDQSENGGLFDRQLSVFTRKAGYHYGWDWGPRLVTSGIWRPVYLEAWEDARIENVQVIQDNVSAKSADINVVAEISADKDIEKADIQIIVDDYSKILRHTVTDLKKGMNKVTVSFKMAHPKLWWSNGLGEPHLYSFETKLQVNNLPVDSKKEKIGIRSIKVVRNPDQYGRSFYFELNGIPVFAKGANYIPCDNFLPRVTPEIYKRTILDAANANMNMLRVWGGGIYENDVFYDLCDQYGILIWQDFMFACSIYPAEGKLLENIRREAADNIRRLRNHACIAIWCGNNECLDAWTNWGWKKSYEKQNPEYAAIIWKQFQDQYFVALPEEVKIHDPGRYYTPTSPFSNIDGRRDKTDGDLHYWEVWHGKKPISEYNVQKSRFFSEYGFQSFPGFESVKIYAPETQDWSITSEVMMSHQRGGSHANSLIETYLLNEYRQPKNFESFLYMNHILQGDAIKTAIEAHRRDMPYCMGSLYWQHNDCWPVASWSSRDYYGCWKALHYYARKAFYNVLVSPIEENQQLNVYIISDRLKSFKAGLSVQVMKMDGTVIFKSNKQVQIPANTSTRLFSEETGAMLKGNNRGDVIISVSLEEKGGKVYDNVYYLEKQKDMNYPKVAVKRSIRPIDGGYEVSLSCDHFARGVFMSIIGVNHFFSDNYFNILPGQTISVNVSTPLVQTEFEKQLKITALSDAY